MRCQRKEIYNFWNWYQAAILVARYRSLANARLWPKATVREFELSTTKRNLKSLNRPP